MAIIADFQKDGLLPPGDYKVSSAELRASVLVAGPGNPKRYPNWDALWREAATRLEAPGIRCAGQSAGDG